MAVEAVATRRRIIPRPRLTNLLDESPARIKLLVAPAGYGKTTLAQQWLEVSERRDVWYRGGPASADVAALAAGIAIAAAEIIPDAGKRMRQRIRTVGHPEEDVDVLAELFAEDVQEWPSDAWLAIDDYHFAMDSAASERLVELLTNETPIQMVLTTRNRPSWASARRILYGEIQEVDRRSLAMEQAEAMEVLGKSDTSADVLVQRARGWPAVLGIAAQLGDLQIPPDDLPDALYDYFAEELYRNAEPPVREALHRLSLVPSLSNDLVLQLLGESAQAAIDKCIRLGAVTLTDRQVVLHPLLRTFIVRKLTREDPNHFHVVASESTRFLISCGDWDAAFQVIAEHSVPELLVSLVSSAVNDLLAEGRTQTLANWLDLAAQQHIIDSTLDLAEAEVAFRQARFAKAELLAANAATSRNERFAARMLVRAGQSAVMDSRDEKGLEYFREAQAIATLDVDRLEAAVGVCFAASELGLAEEAGRAFAELTSIEAPGVDIIVRKAIVEIVLSSRMGGSESALDTGAAVVPLLDDLKNPLVATSFLNCYGHFLGLAANYVDALRVADRHISAAEEYRLTFALPYGYVVRAVAYSGLRDFGKAKTDIARAEELAAPNDIHVSMQAEALRARLALCRGDAETALFHSTRHWDRAASRPMAAEYLAYRALSYACLGDAERADSLAIDARRLHGSSVETVALASCAEAIAVIKAKKGQAADSARRAYDVVRQTGGYDSLVVASRACPDLLQLIAQQDTVPLLSALLSRSNDFDLGREVGIDVRGNPVGPLSELTPREAEIAELVGRGLTNIAIAQRLFISDSTVKVHVRHILRKLNATKRAEIAARVALK